METSKTHFTLRNIDKSQISISIYTDADKNNLFYTEVISLPPKPRFVDITATPYNAVGDGRTLNTESILSAIDDCKTGIEITGFEREGDKVRAHFYNGTGADVSAKLVIAGYTEDGQLKCLSFADANVSSANKDSSIAKMLSANGATRYKVMLWNGADLTPLAKSLDK